MSPYFGGGRGTCYGHDIKHGDTEKHTGNFEMKNTSKSFKYQTSIQCACLKQQGSKRSKIRNSTIVEAFGGWTLCL